VAIRITVGIQGLFSGFVTIGRYDKWLTDKSAAASSHSSILIRQMAGQTDIVTLVRRALAKVCTVTVLLVYLWSPYVIGQTIIFSCCFFFFISSPNLSGRRLDVCHTSTHGVALVRI